MAGVSVTLMAMVSTVPVTLMMPDVAPTESAVAYRVDAKVEAQVSSEVAPADWTISVTQVRAELAARTISDALARRV